jgi:hypothetical protein
MGVLYNSRIVTDGLVFCLDAGDKMSYPGAGTTWTDLSKRGNNGTLTNGPTFDSANGGSIVFDGTNDYVSITRNSSITPNYISICGWIKINSKSSNQFLLALPRSVNGGASYMMYYSLSLDGFVAYARTNSTGTIQTTSTFSPDTGRWYFLSMTSNGSNLILFIDGEFEASLSFSSVLEYSGSTVLRIGSYDNQGTPTYTNGNIPNVSIYNRALSAEEIKQNYLATKGRYA